VSAQRPARVDRPPTPGSGLLVVTVVLFLAAPVALPAWLVASAAVRYGARRWHLAVAGVVPGVLAGWLLWPRMSATLAAAGAAVAGSIGRASFEAPSGLLAPLAGWFGRWALLTAPVGVPAGLVAASVPRVESAVPAPEFEARRRRDARRAEQRRARRAGRRAERLGRDRRSNALGVSMGGMVDSWRIGEDVVPPPGQLGLAWLLIGAPGAGKTTAQYRLGWLAGLERRHLVVLDAKGGHDGLAAGMVAAYRAAWPEARIRLFPNEHLDIWRGDPQAVVNRLVEVWDWSEPYWREVAMTALRLTIGQAGPPCRSGRELVRRLDYNQLVKAWERSPEELSLVKGMRDDLAGVRVRVGNLVAALAGKLDGAVSWEDADCWVVTVPAMVASRDADSALRVLLSDYGHFTMARKARGQAALLMVDEFSAIAGGRRSAIDLLERGRGVGVGVVLAGQSSAALGDEDERSRLLAAASVILLFRTPQPVELAGLAGSERVADAAWQTDADDLTGRATVTMRSRARVDQDAVRQLPTGWAELIYRGVRELVRIIQTDADAIEPGLLAWARELVDAGEQPAPLAVVGEAAQGLPEPPSPPGGRRPGR
jgi:hypothetical protein